MSKRESDYGSWKYYFKVNHQWIRYLYLSYRVDEEISFIMIELRDYKTGSLIHRFYSKEYSKRNLLEAKTYYDLLLVSYRENLPKRWSL